MLLFDKITVTHINNNVFANKSDKSIVTYNQMGRTTTYICSRVSI